VKNVEGDWTRPTAEAQRPNDASPVEDKRSIVERLGECGITKYTSLPKHWDALFVLIGDLTKSGFDLGYAAAQRSETAVPGELAVQVAAFARCGAVPRKEDRDVLLEAALILSGAAMAAPETGSTGT